MALMGDGVQPWVFRSARWMFRSDSRGRRDCSARLMIGTQPERHLRNLCMISCVRSRAGHTEERLLRSSPLPPAISWGVISPWIQGRRYCQKTSSSPWQLRVRFWFLERFHDEMQGFPGDWRTGCFSFLGTEMQRYSVSQRHPKHPVYWQSSKLAYRTSYCWYWNRAGPHEDRWVPPPAFCL